MLNVECSMLQPQPLSPRHFERAKRIPQRLALRLDDAWLAAAVAEHRFEIEADRAAAIDRAVDRVVAADHPAAARRFLETDVAELLKLIVEEGLVLQELQQLRAVE